MGWPLVRCLCPLPDEDGRRRSHLPISSPVNTRSSILAIPVHTSAFSEPDFGPKPYHHRPRLRFSGSPDEAWRVKNAAYKLIYVYTHIIL